MTGAVLALGCAVLVLAGPPAPGPAQVPAPAPASAHATPVLAYRAPVVGAVAVIRPFQAPPGPYAAGHRGVDLVTAPGDAVLAPGSGRVRFAGVVAGRGVVVIEHPDGVSTEYEPLSVTVTAGEPVRRGQPIGRVGGSHGTCPPSGCLHWGARRDGTYFDPMTLLVALGPVRLLPWGP
ncbi:MAG: M23 family metallopeptidase [Pseudonocardiales bacterium]